MQEWAIVGKKKPAVKPAVFSHERGVSATPESVDQSGRRDPDGLADRYLGHRGVQARRTLIGVTIYLTYQG